MTLGYARPASRVIMPNLTGVKYRSSYQLYDGKPCQDDSPAHGCLAWRVAMVGDKIGYHQRGDSRRFFKRAG